MECREKPKRTPRRTNKKAEIAGDKKAVKLRKRIKRAEENRAMWAKLRRIAGKLKSGGLNFILEPAAYDSEGNVSEWTPIFDEELIQDKLLKRNKKHFAQAEGTPFADEELMELLGQDGTSPLAQHVLNGGELPNTQQMGRAVKAILKSLEALTDEPINIEITPGDLTAGIKKWREGTTTSESSKCHLGHYKAMVCETLTNECDEIRGKMLEMKASLMSIASMHGFVYDRWMIIYNQMLEKIEGQPRMDKLRIINLYEADLNLLLGIIYRRAVYRAEELQALGDEAWGSRKGKQTLDPLFLKLLSYMISEMSLTSLGSFDNDASACYDRMVVLLAILRARQLGMPESIGKLLVEIQNKAKYHIKTNIGVSEAFYGSDSSGKVQGFGQGRRDASHQWLLISTMIMMLMKEVSNGASFNDPINVIEVKTSQLEE